ncbi:MAG TPA: ATP-binding protein [Ohtaekwangia sp.]
MRCLVYTLISILAGSTAFAQSKILDSLENLLHKTEDKKIQADILHTMASESWDYDFEKGYGFANRSYEIADETNYIKGMAVAASDMGLYYYFIGDRVRCLEFYSRAKLLSAADPGPYQATILIRLGTFHREGGNFDSASYYYNRSATMIDPSRPSRPLAMMHHGKGWLDYYRGDFVSSRSHFKKSLGIQEQLNDSMFMADNWKTLGLVASAMNRFDSAEMYFAKVKGISERFDNPELKIFYTIYRGELQFKKGELVDATRLFTEALDLLNKHDYKRHRAAVLKNIGQVFEWQGQYESSFAYFFNALRIEEAMNNLHEMAHTYDMMGWGYANQKNFGKASEMAERSGDIFRRLKDHLGLADYYILSGFIAFQKSDYTGARMFYDSALHVRRQAQSPILIANVLNFMSQLSIAQSRYDEAARFERERFDINSATGNYNGMVAYYNNMSKIMLARKQYGEAEKFGLQAYHDALTIASATEARSACLTLSQTFTQAGQFEKATQYYQRYIHISDSLYTAESASRQAQLNALYALEKREERIRDLNKENEVQKTLLENQNEQLRFQNTVLVLAITGCVLLAALAFTLFRFYKSKNLANEKLNNLNREITEKNEEIQAQSEELTQANHALVKLNEELVEKTEEVQAQSEELRETNEMISEINRDLDNIVTKRTAQLNEAYKELDTFFYRSSHDFRRPLTTFMGLAEVAKVTLKDQSALDLFARVNETARSLDKMLIKLQSISDVGTQELVYKEVLIREIFDNVCDAFREDITRMNFRTSCSVTITKPFVSYPAMIRIILENLIENSIHFSTPRNPCFQLTAHNEGDMLVMEMEDNGPGILKEYELKVFQMYFRGSERSKGNGLGLYIVRKACEKLGGTITLDTSRQEGCRFIISLPMNYKELNRWG